MTDFNMMNICKNKAFRHLLPSQGSLKLIIIIFIFIFIFNMSFSLSAKEAGAKNLIAGEAGADSFIASDFYVHKWIKLPSIKGLNFKGKRLEQKPKKGYVDILVFIASWCIKCQQLTSSILNLEKKYVNKNTRFTYIFSHDLPEDVKSFAKSFGIREGIIAGHEILKLFHNPDLPTIYIGDRHGWLLSRYLNMKNSDVNKIDKLLSKITSY